MQVLKQTVNFFAFKWFVLTFKTFCYFGKITTISQWSMKIMVHVGKAHSAFKKMNPLLSDCCYPDVLTTQWPTPKRANLKWMNSDCRSVRVIGYPRQPLGLCWFPDKLFFFFNGIKPSSVAGLMPLQWKKKKVKNVSSTWSILSTTSSAQGT